jgi:RNAse (barnase) inhibitor barstar
MSGIKGLSSEQKVGLRNIIRKMEKDPSYVKLVKKEIIDNGGKVDMKKILKKFAPNITKEALIQSTLFILMQKYPEETAKFIFGGLELFKELTGIDLLKKLSNYDKNPDDEETISAEDIIKQFQNYEEAVNQLLKFIDSSDQLEIKDKYGVDLSTLKDKIFNPKDPLFPDQLMELNEIIAEFIDNVNAKETVNPPESPESIKVYVEEQFDTIKQFIEIDQESESNLKELWDIYKNNPPKNADLYFDDFEDWRQLKKDYEMLENL